MVKNGINFEILCLGCQATFKGDRPVAYFPEEGCLTRRLFKGHCLRSTRNHGPTAPCAYRGRQYVEVHYGGWKRSRNRGLYLLSCLEIWNASF